MTLDMLVPFTPAFAFGVAALLMGLVLIGLLSWPEPSITNIVMIVAALVIAGYGGSGFVAFAAAFGLVAACGFIALAITVGAILPFAVLLLIQAVGQAGNSLRLRFG